MTSIDHNFVNSCCSLPWLAQSASQALSHGRFFFHSFCGNFPKIVDYCACSLSTPFPQRMSLSMYHTPYSRTSWCRCVACCLLFALDSSYNSVPTLTLLTFLRVNASSVSLFYGSAPWHYYFTQALPLLAGPALPFVLHGAYRAFMDSPRHIKLLLYMTLWTSAVFSCAGHKEWRFLHPLLPVMHLFAAWSLVSLHDRTNPRYGPRRTILRIKRTHVVLLGLLSLAPSLYVMGWHSSAQIEVLSHLRGLSDTELRSVGFLMPCHSTPGQSHLHRRIPVWRLTCEPPLQ